MHDFFWQGTIKKLTFSCLLMLSLQLPSALKHPLTKWALQVSRDKIIKGIIFWASEKKCTKIGSVKNSNSNWWYKTVPLDFSLFVASKFAQVILFLAFHFFPLFSLKYFLQCNSEEKKNNKNKRSVIKRVSSRSVDNFFRLLQNI